MVIGALLVAAFIAWEMRTRQPMLPMHLFRSRGFTLTNAASLLMFFGMFGSIFLLAQFLQVVQHYSPLQAGLRTLPWTAIAPQGQLQPARHGVPGDGGDDRFGQLEPADPHRPVTVRGHPVAAVGAERGQVGAGAENPALAVQHSHRGLRIGVEGPEGIGQPGGGRAVDRVPASRAVQEDGADRP